MHPVQSPRTDDSAIEAEIQAKGLTAPRVTPKDIADNIASEHYFTAYEGAKSRRITRDEPKDSDALKLLTFCVLVLRSGFTVTGESACASPENFDRDVGRKIAFENAKQKLWPLMGYALKERLHAPASLTDEDAKRLAKLTALERAGVDNWEGYDDALPDDEPQPPPADNAHVAPGCEKFGV